MPASLRLVASRENPVILPADRPAPGPHAYAQLMFSSSLMYWAAACCLWHSLLSAPAAAWKPPERP
jgi:hypothetical protein